MIAEQFKRSILQAAIEGKLTEQLPEAGDARDLLKEIEKEKAHLTNEGKIKKEKPLPEITEEEIPFELPKGWEWVRLGTITKLITKGSSPKWQGVNYVEKNYGILFITSENVSSYHLDLTNEKYVEKTFNKIEPRSILEKGDILMNIVGASIGRTALFELDQKGANINQAVCLIRLCGDFISKNYLLYFFNSNLCINNMFDKQVETARPNLSMGNIANFLIPIPPLAEQNRIVNRINEILSEIDQLKADEFKLDSLQRAFPKKIRDSILQSAVEGKLTEQLPSVGDARDLVKEVQKEKDRLVKEGKIKKENPLPEISEDEVPFDIPDNWCWARISDVLLFQEGPGIMAVDFRNTGVPLIRISGLQSDRVTLQGCNYLDREKVKKKWNHFRLEDGDICISTSASLDKVAVVDEEAVGAVPYTGIIRFKSYGVFNLLYFKFFVQTSFYANQIRKYSAGGTIKHYGPSHLRKMIIPVPPLTEQQRIVQRLDELLPEVAKLQINEF